MSPSGRLSVAAIIAASVVITACGNPPEKEMQQAQGAIDVARAVGADQYAHEEFVAAQDALKHAHEAVDQRDYRLALNHALDSRERAQNAAEEAADQRAAARAEADRMLTDATAALGEAALRLKTADAAHASARALVGPRRLVAAGDEAVQEARAAFRQGDYVAVTDALAGVTARLRLVARDLDAVAAPAPRRRR